ncbi:MAG TPA: 2-oxoacid:acceptor oxidoreductase family protein [Patescibacteria group bacterium]|nr:2-oxoacid:acceptor oxidoreductase family protein [Patescibacteria group bacterium]
MKQEKFDIFVIGVGGQGIGLLSETLIRAADYAGKRVRGVDTHGLAQRGGMVASHVRIGANAHSPLVMAGQAEMVVALERHEALRGMNLFLKDGGTLVYYDAVWQPLNVRLKKEAAVTAASISAECRARDIREVRVFQTGLADPRMQNVAVLAEICRLNLIPGLEAGHVEAALNDLLAGPVLEKNLALFRKIVQA